MAKTWQPCSRWSERESGCHRHKELLQSLSLSLFLSDTTPLSGCSEEHLKIQTQQISANFSARIPYCNVNVKKLKILPLLLMVFLGGGLPLIWVALIDGKSPSLPSFLRFPTSLPPPPSIFEQHLLFGASVLALACGHDSRFVAFPPPPLFSPPWEMVTIGKRKAD